MHRVEPAKGVIRAKPSNKVQQFALGDAGADKFARMRWALYFLSSHEHDN